MYPLSLRAADRRRILTAAARLCTAAALALPTAGCVISTSYRTGPGPQPSGAGTIVVAITGATLTADRQARSAFWRGVEEVENDLSQRAGMLGYRLRREPFGSRVWTMTLWAGEEDLAAFLAAPVHRNAMRQGNAAIAELRVARLAWPALAAPPSWDEALAALQNGRNSYE